MSETQKRSLLHILFDIRGERVPTLPAASSAPRPPMRRGIYILPSLFTLGNMGLGFYSLTQTVRQEYSAAATAILIGHVLDILDGVVARLTHTSSRFGVELDSLADWMTFVIAPAFLMYEMVLKNNPSWGFVLSVLFVICGALRLARFNLKAHLGEPSTGYFTGLPTPAAGGVLAIFALLYSIQEVGRPIRSLGLVMKQVPVFYEVVPAVMLLLSLLMVSNVRYAKFRVAGLLRPRGLRALVISVLVLLMIWVYPQNMIFILYVSYIGWGVVSFFLRPRMGAPPKVKDDPLDSYGK
ncbi:MAG: CDP-diacylglycerol--serine O-phosphatidyltransferase [Elusimicrobia bacterium]|nr:CDP-diacylglycerol--serine O-phosphatidyltransferase [Elusimicrobiota bacterium]MBP9128022.1 CDP-diacylglycerol--serine O-phosphatidyltransferase [Elusimicrobiota bacterium]MBP9699106.1 CDP-diacylglycerol--serine O-phosphatidyltransferase [Elusimicrobiota bacterium]